MLKSWQHISAGKTEVLCAEAVLAHLAGMRGMQRRWGRLPSHGEPRTAPAFAARLPCCPFPGQVAAEETFLNESHLQLQKQPMSFAVGFVL